MIIDSGIVTGSLQVIGNTEVTGSLKVTEGITGSLNGNADTSTSASHADQADTATNALTASYLSGYVSPFPFTGSAIVSGSLIITGSTASSQGFTGSLSGNADTSTSASYALASTSASHAISANSAISASSLPYSGLTGTVPTWNQDTTGNAATATSSSYATNATSASYALNSTSSSFAINADTVDGIHASAFVPNSATSSFATQTYVNTAVSNLVDSSPSTLDTLNELAAALGDDPNFATTVATSIGTKQAQLNGTGFVKISGTTVSYDNNTYYSSSNPSGFINSNGSITGNAATATSASYAATATNATSASYALNSTNASSATTAGSATSASYALSASYARTSTSASYATTATSAASATTSTSASYALSATSAGSATTAGSATSASYAATATSAASATTSTSSSYASNADTVDGYHASYFATSDHSHVISPVNETSVSPYGISIQAGPGGGNAPGWTHPYGTKLSAITSAGRSFEIMTTTYPDGQLVLRTLGDGNTWDAWKTVLDSNNYNTYAPTKSGTGASGTWGISITGTAGGVAWGNVSSKPTTLSGYGITDSLYQASVDINVNVNAFNATGLYRGSTGNWTNRPTAVHNGGALLQIDTHPGNYHQQLFFDSGGNRLYMRSADAGTWGSWVTMVHSGNYTSYSPSLTGTGASGNWGINITGNAATATSATNADTVDNYHASSFAKQAYVNVGYNFDTMSSTDTNGGTIYRVESSATNPPTTGVYNWSLYQQGDSTRGSQIAISAYSQNRMFFRGANGSTSAYFGWNEVIHNNNYNDYAPTKTGTGASGTWGISTTGNSYGLSITGYGSGNMSYFQGSGTFAGYSGWAGYFISNHGDGATYYNQTIIMPFWDRPQYSRQQGNTTIQGPYTFWTSEGTITSGYSIAAPIFYDQNDTTYYADLNSTGVSINARGGIKSSGYNSAGSAFSMNWPHSGWIDMWGSTGQIMNISSASGLAVNLAVTGDVTAYYSDERLKDRKGNVVNALSKLISLNGFYYTDNNIAKTNGYNNDDVQLGLSAQEVQKEFPEIVSLAPFDTEYNDNGEKVSKSGENYLTVNYSKLVPVLVEAIKEQQTQIDELKQLVKQLTNK